jgi:hypothetical protein
MLYCHLVHRGFGDAQRFMPVHGWIIVTLVLAALVLIGR